VVGGGEGVAIYATPGICSAAVRKRRESEVVVCLFVSCDRRRCQVSEHLFVPLIRADWCQGEGEDE
jgi:hypothetical protein